MPAFAHPAAAWLAPAIILPIVFHLFFRMRRQVRDFPALLFFQRIDPRLSARRKIHEWIVLFLRCLFIALLLAALLRPIMGVHQESGSVARLVLIDNSGSMAGTAHSGITKWNLTKNAVLQLISSLKPGDGLAVQLMVPDPTVSLPDGFDATPTVLRDAIGKLVVSDGAASIPKAMRRALATLDGAKAPRRELIVITDLQRDNWSKGEYEPEPTTSHVVVRRLASEPPTAGQIAFQTLELPTRAIPVGRITPLRTTLQNAGPQAGKAHLDSADDSGKNQTRDLDVPAHGTNSATLTFSFTTPGFHWAEEWVEGDTATTAIRSDLGFWITDVRKVLFVGTAGDFGALPYAVSPGGTADLTGLNSVYVDPNQVVQNLNDDPVAVVTTWDRVDPSLEQWVQKGGTLLIFPRPGSGATAPNPWIGASVGDLHAAAGGNEPMLLLKDDDNLWHDLRDDSGRPALGSLRVFNYAPVLAPGSDWEPLIAAGKGGTLLSRRTVGKGHIYACGFGFTPKDSSLPLKASFVVMVQNLIFGDAIESIPVRLIHAGDDITLPGGNLSIKSMAGSPLAWQGQGRTFTGFPRAGIYEIRQPDHVEWVEASANPDEAHADFLPLGPIPLLRNLPHDIAPLAHEDDLTHVEATPATTSSFFRWLLLAALLIILFETWLANERSSEIGMNLFKSKKKQAAAEAPNPASITVTPPKNAKQVKKEAKAKRAKARAATPVAAKPVVAAQPRIAQPTVAQPKVVQPKIVKAKAP